MKASRGLFTRGKKKAEGCGHLMPDYDGHSYCSNCRIDGVGSDPCAKAGTNPCILCDALAKREGDQINKTPRTVQSAPNNTKDGSSTETNTAVCISGRMDSWCKSKDDHSTLSFETRSLIKYEDYDISTEQNGESDQEKIINSKSLRYSLIYQPTDDDHTIYAEVNNEWGTERITKSASSSHSPNIQPAGGEFSARFTKDKRPNKRRIKPTIKIITKFKQSAKFVGKSSSESKSVHEQKDSNVNRQEYSQDRDSNDRRDHSQDRGSYGRREHSPDRGSYGGQEHSQDRGSYDRREHKPDRGSYDRREHSPDRGSYGGREHSQDRGSYARQEHSQDRGSYDRREHKPDRGSYDRREHSQDRGSYDRQEHSPDRDSYGRREHSQDRGSYGRREHSPDRGSYGGREHSQDRGSYERRKHSPDRGSNGGREQSQDRGSYGGREHSQNRDSYGGREHSQDRGSYGRREHSPDRDSYGRREHSQDRGSYERREHSPDRGSYDGQDHSQDRGSFDRREHKPDRGSYDGQEHSQDRGSYDRREHKPDRGSYDRQEHSQDRGSFDGREHKPDRGSYHRREHSPDKGSYDRREHSPDRGSYDRREDSPDRGSFDGREHSQDRDSYGGREHFQDRGSYDGRDHSPDRGSYDRREHSQDRDSYDRREHKPDRGSYGGREHSPDGGSCDGQEHSQDRGSYDRREHSQDRGSYDRREHKPDRGSYDEREHSPDRGSFKRWQQSQDRGSYDRREHKPDRGSYDRREHSQDRGSYDRREHSHDRGSYDRREHSPDRGSYDSYRSRIKSVDRKRKRSLTPQPDYHSKSPHSVTRSNEHNQYMSKKKSNLYDLQQPPNLPSRNKKTDQSSLNPSHNTNSYEATDRESQKFRSVDGDEHDSQYRHSNDRPPLNPRRFPSESIDSCCTNTRYKMDDHNSSKDRSVNHSRRSDSRYLPKKSKKRKHKSSERCSETSHSSYAKSAKRNDITPEINRNDALLNGKDDIVDASTDISQFASDNEDFERRKFGDAQYTEDMKALLNLNDSVELSWKLDDSNAIEADIVESVPLTDTDITEDNKVETSSYQDITEDDRVETSSDKNIKQDDKVETLSDSNLTEEDKVETSSDKNITDETVVVDNIKNILLNEEKRIDKNPTVDANKVHFNLENIIPDVRLITSDDENKKDFKIPKYEANDTENCKNEQTYHPRDPTLRPKNRQVYNRHGGYARRAGRIEGGPWRGRGKEGKNGGKGRGGKKGTVCNNQENDPPPDDFRKLDIIPTAEDVLSTKIPFLRVNKVMGAYHNLEHYLDVQFRLLKEDFVRPLRDGITEYLNMVNHRNKAKPTGVRIYHNVKVLNTVYTRTGISHRIKFDISNLKRIRSQNTESLKFGSLLFLSCDNFRTLYFAVVANSETELMEKGEVEVQFVQDINNTPPNQRFVMAEATSYFEASRYVLHALQTIPADLPFQKYLVNVDQNIQCPKYLNGNIHKEFDMSCLCEDLQEENVHKLEMSQTDLMAQLVMDEDAARDLHKERVLATGGRRNVKKVQLLDEKTWPTLEQLHLDKSQFTALRLALTQELAIIQGPPGTGKTYIGLKIVRCLLHNKSFWQKRGPILVVCYTNHALDQFLEGIHEYCREDVIVRVGARSKSDILSGMNLRELRRKARKNRSVPKAIFAGRVSARAEMNDLKRKLCGVRTIIASTEQGSNDMQEGIREYERQYQNAANRLKENMKEEDKFIMKNAQVIGMTTTGAAKNRDILQELNPKIIVVEEAAEVLEAHIVTTLSSACEHLILIGDHKQLRPNPTVYELAETYNLKISLFERLIKNGISHKTLAKQHRMSPEISQFMKHIYPNLIDDTSVLECDLIKGVEKNVFLLSHNFEETHDDDLKSKGNNHEAKFIPELCHYLMKQGYSKRDITVLTPYSGQVRRLRKNMPKKTFNGIHITTIDNFQGEENEIIIISLVRSQKDANISINKAKRLVGFLKDENRICVTFSRAKKGMYVLGNFELLEKCNNLWRKIITTAKSNGMFGDALELYCQNHPEQKHSVKRSEDFKSVPEGGCMKPCDYRLDLCGHVCSRVCHTYDQEHKDYKCLKPCGKTMCENNHKCRKLCYQKCGDCKIMIEKFIPKCKHIQRVPCSVSAETLRCRSNCDLKLPCGHGCRKKCGESHTDKCRVPVQRNLDCGHIVKMKCCEERTYNCTVTVKRSIACGHIMQMKCCEERTDKCREPVQRTIACGHIVQMECCEEKTYNCTVTVKRIMACGHIVQMECYEDVYTYPCTEKCNAILDCDHLCTGTCGKCHQGLLHYSCQSKCERKKLLTYNSAVYEQIDMHLSDEKISSAEKMHMITNKINILSALYKLEKRAKELIFKHLKFKKNLKLLHEQIKEALVLVLLPKQRFSEQEVKEFVLEVERLQIFLNICQLNITIKKKKFQLGEKTLLDRYEEWLINKTVLDKKQRQDMKEMIELEDTKCPASGPGI